MTEPLASRVADLVDGLAVLDGPGRTIAGVVRGALDDGPAKHALSGAWLGHALHPLLTDLPIGSFTSATVLDLFGADSARAADRLIGFGLLATPATALTGWSDWADAEDGSAAVRRAGIVHAATNVTGIGLMVASYNARKRGRRGRGKLLSLTGMGIFGAAGWLGGHLSYTLGAGVEATAPATATASAVRT